MKAAYSIYSQTCGETWMHMLWASNACSHLLRMQPYTQTSEHYNIHDNPDCCISIDPSNTYWATSNALSIILLKWYSSWAVRVIPRATIVDVSAPVAIGATLHIIAVVLLSYQAHITWGIETVGRIYHLDVLDVTRLPEPFIREVSTTHMCGSLASIRWKYLAAPHNRGGAICQVGEDGRWPIPHIIASHLQPPIAPRLVLQAKIILLENKTYMINHDQGI